MQSASLSQLTRLSVVGGMVVVEVSSVVLAATVTGVGGATVIISIDVDVETGTGGTTVVSIAVDVEIGSDAGPGLALEEALTWPLTMLISIWYEQKPQLKG